MSRDIISNTVISTRVRLARNFEGMPFPNKLKRNHPDLEKIVNSLYNSTKVRYENVKFYQIDRMDEIEKQAMLEKHLVSPNLIRNDLTGALMLIKDKSLSVMINEEDHIRAQCVMSGLQLEEGYKTLQDFDKVLQQSATVAFDPKLGYLTACPTNLGLGMRASVMLFLPALAMSGELKSIIKSIETVGLTVRGLYGEGSDGVGYMYQISNARSLGISAKEILDRVNIVVRNVCEREDLMRLNIYKSQGVWLEDKIMRAKGTLLYARKISSQEFMQAISLVKLGVALEMFEYDIPTINKLIDQAQPANLCCYTNKLLDDEQRDIARAQLIRDTLSN